jgi:hypothetical protein
VQSRAGSDSTVGDSIDRSVPTGRAGSTTADTLTGVAARDDSVNGGPSESPTFTLDDFIEVQLETGLETSTRVEILSGLKEGDRVAADPTLIRRKKKEQAESPEGKDGKAKRRWYSRR